MDCVIVGRELAVFLIRLHADGVGGILESVGEARGWTKTNLFVLYFWIASWRVSELMPAELAQPVLDSMHEGLFLVLEQSDVEDDEAESFVQQRYAEYHDAVKTREGGAVLHRIGSCFVGFCNPDADGQMKCSADLSKIMSVTVDVASVARGVDSALEVLVKKYSR